MRRENYKDEVNFSEEQIKRDRRRDPAIDYSYDDKGSIFRKLSKSRAEKKMHKEGHIGYSDSNASKESKELFNTLKNEYKNMQGSAENNRNKRFYNQKNKSNKRSKSSGYKICKNCGAQMYSDAKVCPKCGEDQKKSNTGGFVMRTIFKFIGIIVIINLIIGTLSLIFIDEHTTYEEEIATEETSSEEPYIDYEEYSKPVKLKYIANLKDVIKTDKEKCTVGNGKDIPAGEYIFVKNEGSSLGSIELFSELDQENSELYETTKRNYYIKLEDGDTVKLYNGTLYKADQVELDMTDENNKKSGMYRIGKDVGDTFTIEGNSRTYYAIFDADNIIINNGFLDEGNITIDPEFIEEKAIQGETAKYIFVSDGIIK